MPNIGPLKQARSSRLLHAIEESDESRESES